jgi:hypothetical protein
LTVSVKWLEDPFAELLELGVKFAKGHFDFGVPGELDIAVGVTLSCRWGVLEFLWIDRRLVSAGTTKPFRFPIGGRWLRALLTDVRQHRLEADGSWVKHPRQRQDDVTPSCARDAGK